LGFTILVARAMDWSGIGPMLGILNHDIHLCHGYLQKIERDTDPTQQNLLGYSNSRV
jgi:hypothetical protein